MHDVSVVRSLPVFWYSVAIMLRDVVRFLMLQEFPVPLISYLLVVLT
jgi:hypothetical protein